jgi:hypothetical protein
VKLLLDINVVLDVLLARSPWMREAALLVTRNERDFRGIPIPVRSAGEILALL